jgi:hypothetical protein
MALKTRALKIRALKTRALKKSALNVFSLTSKLSVKYNKALSKT